MSKINYSNEALDYIAKIADGGMRDAITMMDKCLAYSNDLTLENVIKALGTTDYQTLFDLTDAVVDGRADEIIDIVETVHSSGKDLKQFIRSYMNFLVDLCKYSLTKSYKYIAIPSNYDMNYSGAEFVKINHLLQTVVRLNADIKWDTTPKYAIEAVLMLEVSL